MKCIYCSSRENLTSSDIISYAITGTKLTKSFVCHTHNAFTNDNYEKKFIADLDFFRNQLGLSTREGKPIQYWADISIGGADVHNVKMSNRKSLYSPKNVVSGVDDNGKKVLIAPIEKLEKIKGGKVTTVDINDVTLHKTISSDDFIGFSAIHSVAKMAYEWYCYNNNIEEFYEEYKEIVDYILGNGNDLVDIVLDGNYYAAIDQLSEVGTNALFQYDDVDGYRYVVFDLWKTISYRVKICKVSENVPRIDNVNPLPFEVHLYRLDGSKSKTVFEVICLDGSRKLKLITAQPESINLELWKIFVKRIEKIMTTMVLSIHILKREVDSIASDLKKYDAGKIDIAQLLGYEENNIAAVLEIMNLLYENKEKYNDSKSFNENLALVLNLSSDIVTRTTEDKKVFIASLVEMDKKGILSDHIRNGICTFNSIYEIEMKRT